MVRGKLTAGMRRMTAIAKQWAKRIGIALAAAFTAAIWAATKFEEQMANVATMLTETTMKAMRGFEKGIGRLAIAFGQSTETLAKGLYDILSAGIAASKGMAVLETASRAAIAGVTNTAVAVDVITTVLNSYSMSASKAEDVSDALFATVKAGKLTFQELSQFLGMVTAPAAAAGLKLEELLAALATLTRAGVRPRIAVTYLRQAVMAFAKSTPDAQKAADKFGLALKSNTLRTIGLLGVMDKLKHASLEQIAAIFSSNEAFNAMITLKGDLLGLEGDIEGQYNRTGRMMTAYNKIASIMAQKLRQVKEVAIGVGRAFGKEFLESLKAVAQWFIDNEKVMRVWAQKAAVQVLYLAAVLKNFWQHTDFKGKWQSMIDSILIMLKTFVKAAIVLAVAAGKGIYRGVKEGVLGSGERRIGADARKRYELLGGKYRKPTIAEGPTLKKDLVEDQKKWAVAMEMATKAEQHRSETLDPIVGPAWEQVKDIMVEGAEKANEALEKPLDAAGLAAKQYLEQWRTWKLAMIDQEAKTEDATKAIKDETDVRKKIYEELQRPEKEKEKEKEKPTISFLGLTEFWKRIQTAAMPQVKTEAVKLQEKQLVLQRQQLEQQRVTNQVLNTIRTGAYGGALARG